MPYDKRNASGRSHGFSAWRYSLKFGGLTGRSGSCVLAAFRVFKATVSHFDFALLFFYKLEIGTYFYVCNCRV